MGLLEVVGLVDRSEARLLEAGKLFPNAQTHARLDDAPLADLALIATPARSHTSLAFELLQRGYHLLVEKPICTSANDAAAIQAEAHRLGRVLAVGHFRRFFPALETLRSVIASGIFGAVRRVVAEEGGTFRWPAASEASFVKKEGGGGVTLDIGIHMLEILVSWLGVPEVLSYADDAMGGVEINSTAELRWPGGAEGSIRLSWDVPLANRYRVEFDRAVVTWRTNQATDLLIELDGVPMPQLATSLQPHGHNVEYAVPSHSYLGAFTAQWRNVVEAIQRGGEPRVTAQTAGAALALVDAMYARKQLLDIPYLEPSEQSRAQQLWTGAAL